jgi:predicted GIY-YIG superfamily endonuclease
MNVPFLFNGALYRQVDGISMGSPLGPLLADIFTAKLEQSTLASSIQQLDMYCRYVDDTFVLCPASQDIDHLLVACNNAHPSIQFTMEKEEGGALPFLDVLLKRRENGTLQRSVYRKASWVGQYINFQSFVPLQRKRNLVKNLAFRARSICSDDTIQEEFDFLHMTFLRNGYPEKFVQKNLKEQTSRKPVFSVQKKKVYLRLQYKGEIVSERNKNRIARAVESAYPAANLQVFYTNRPILTPCNKDKLPCSTASSVVYLFSCSCGASYIGRTTRRLVQRTKEHIPSWLARGESRQVKSSILGHLIDLGHSVNVEQAFKVIYRTEHSRSKGLRQRFLNTAEAVAIRLHKPTLCVQKEFTQALLLPWPDAAIW